MWWGVLGGAVERELPHIRLAEREHRAWLDCRADQTVVDEIERDDMGCPTKTLAHRGLVPAPPAKADIGRGARMQLRGISRLRGTRIGDRRQRLIVDLDALGRIRRLLAGLGDHCRHRLADMAHGVARQRKARRLGHWRAVVRADDPERPHRGDVVGRHIRAAENCNDAWQDEGGSCIDAANAGVGVRRTHERAMHGTGHIDVADVSAVAEQETPILDAAQRHADAFHITLPRLRREGEGAICNPSPAAAKASRHSNSCRKHRCVQQVARCRICPLRLVGEGRSVLQDPLTGEGLFHHSAAAKAGAAASAGSRSFGITFCANKVMLLRVSSAGMLPICIIATRTLKPMSS